MKGSTGQGHFLGGMVYKSDDGQIVSWDGVFEAQLGPWAI